jgi:anthranilate phosphoribosyltransferase
MVAQHLARWVAAGTVSPDELAQALEVVLAGHASDVEQAALLAWLRGRGDRADDVVAAATVLRRHMVPLDVGGVEVVDTCGTGGDGQGLFNISTAAALVAAACGVPVVKHGNRGVSSTSGSADVLAALGWPLDRSVDDVARGFANTGFAFCFAPQHHPAMRHVAAVRRQLKFRTLFNLVGPLVNPAGAKRQVVGVGEPALMDIMAAALQRLGTRRAFVVHGEGGVDELTLAGTTDVIEVTPDGLRRRTWTPEDFGLVRQDLASCRVADATHSAAVIRAVLAGVPGPAADAVVLNAAAALLVADASPDPATAAATARAALATGRAAALLAAATATDAGA